MRRIVILGMIAAIAMGCTRKVYVPVETVHTEFKERVNEIVLQDSVTDSRLVYIQGDTVIDWRDRVRWRNREIHDTVIHVIHDSVPVPYEVEKRLTKWEQAKMDAGGFAMGGVAIALCIAVIWLIKKLRG